MKLREQLLGMSEVMGGRPLTDAGVMIMVAALAKYPAQSVRIALARVARECRGLSLPDILERLPGASPGAEEAWAICSCAYDEGATVVWTEAMAQSFGDVRHMTDKVAARMAFKDIYLRIRGTVDGLPSWSASMGHDPKRRIEAVNAAAVAGRLSAPQAKLLGAGLAEREERKALPAPAEDNSPKLEPAEVSTLAEAVMAKLKGAS